MEYTWIITLKYGSVTKIPDEIIIGSTVIWKGKKSKEVGVDKRTNKILVKIDPNFYRPSDIHNLLGDSSKAKKILKWKPKTSIKKLIKVMIKEELLLIEQNKLY